MVELNESRALSWSFIDWVGGFFFLMGLINHQQGKSEFGSILLLWRGSRSSLINLERQGPPFTLLIRFQELSEHALSQSFFMKWLFKLQE